MMESLVKKKSATVLKKEVKEKLLQKKKELLQQLAIDGKLNETAKGDFYVYLNMPEVKTVLKTAPNITKNMVKTLGTSTSFLHSANRQLLMLTSKGKLLIKNMSWQEITVKYLRAKEDYSLSVHKYALHKIFLIGKKYEWISDYLDTTLLACSLARQCSSLKEFKTFLGYEFLSNEQFMAMYKADMYSIMLSNIHADKETKLKIVDIATNSTKRMYLIDTLKMSFNTGIPFDLTANASDLKEIHDNYVRVMNQQKADSYSTQEYTVETDIINNLVKAGYEVEHLNSERKLFLKGAVQHHCLGSYCSSLKYDLFLSIKEAGTVETFEAQIKEGLGKTTVLNQFLGFKNSSPNDDFKETVKSIVSNSTGFTVKYNHSDSSYVGVKASSSSDSQFNITNLPYDCFNKEVQSTFWKSFILNKVLAEQEVHQKPVFQSSIKAVVVRQEEPVEMPF